ncbi:MAG: hypothetical protein L0332_05515 [Chloroflexi bacterium]|nr:hypothetical protein [Chloroflexota bacterium]MCI0576864.1 hypothetical protein [Chloroflexota bacterium]MCI0646482.1 hypothetical protein [Chloroflexota bacterium]MCI0726166.1 hypothetical protein [Chloroflexota bacterium]
MNATNYISQWGGPAFMLGSALFLVNKLNEMSRLFLSRWMPDVISGEDIWLIALGQVAFIIGYVGYFRLYADRAGRFGKTTLYLFCGGGILLAIGHISFMPVLPFDAFILVIIGLMLMLIGLILFGIVNLRRPILARWQWLPLATGLMGFIGFFLFTGEEMTAVFLLFRTLFALGLLGLGLAMWLEKSVAPPEEVLA